MALERICAVVGMGTGVSLAVARRFGREGYRIASIARRPDSLAAAEAALREAGIEARSFEGDAADEASLVRVLSAIRAQMGDPEVLVYNASAGTPGPPTSLSPNALQ